MNKNLKGAVYAFIFFALIIAALIFLPPGYLPAAKGPATATPQDTLTPTSTNTVFTAHIKFDTACRSGPGEDHEMVEKVEQGKDMMLIAKDKEPPEWLLIRGVGFQDCWVDGKFVNSPDLSAAAIFPTPQPPTPTAVPTRTLPPTKTMTPSATNTPKVNATPGPTRTRKPGDTEAPLHAVTNTSNPSINTAPGSGGTSQPTKTTSNSSTNTSRPPTNTSRPPTNTPKPPTRTPVPSPTTDPPHRACNDGVDNDGDGFIDLADSGCSNKGDDSE